MIIYIYVRIPISGKGDGTNEVVFFVAVVVLFFFAFW